MNMLELIELGSDDGYGFIVCSLQTNLIKKDIRFNVDNETYTSLHQLIKKYPGCRYRFLPTELDNHSNIQGKISVIHSRFIKHVLFASSITFLSEINRSLGFAPIAAQMGAHDQGEGGQAGAASTPTLAKKLKNSKKTTRHRRYIAGLDGLRAISILAVIAYHLHLEIVPGGFLGVTIFFVLSGYLITDMLMAEWMKNGRINLKNFWLRRARRLLPSLFLMISVILLWIIIYQPDALSRVWGTVTTSLFFVSNWWMIFHEVPYFEQFSSPDPFGHLWSLGIEEQFYLIWPIIIILILKRFYRIQAIMLFLFCGIFISSLLMLYIYEPGFDLSRVYFGTDTRAFSLLLGAAAAVIFPSSGVSRHLSRMSPRILDRVGAVALLGILIIMWRANEYGGFLYHGGMLLLSVLCTVTIVAVVHPQSVLGKLLGNSLFQWIGKRSYGLYLWHYPIILLTSPTINTDGVHWWRIVLQITLFTVIAALSWTLFEQPILKGNLRMPLQVRKINRFRFVRITLPVFSLLILCAIPFLAGQKSDTKPPGTQGANQVETQTEDPIPMSHSDASNQENNEEFMNPASLPTNSDAEVSNPVHTELNMSGVTIIGDSIIQGIEPYLQENLSEIIVDSEIGRQMQEVPDIITTLDEKNQLFDIVVIALGSNGPFSKGQLGDLLQSMADKHIILVNTRVPRNWQNTVNRALTDLAKEYQNVTLVDWYAKSKGKSSYFEPDGVHLTLDGAKIYANLIMDSINNSQSGT